MPAEGPAAAAPRRRSTRAPRAWNRAKRGAIWAALPKLQRKQSRCLKVQSDKKCKIYFCLHAPGREHLAAWYRYPESF